MTARADNHTSSPGVSRSKRFQVLALDGGGLRGIFAAAALAQLEKDFETDVAGRFDLITGTSTGGLIALALAAGRSPAEVTELYEKMGESIFPRSRLRRLRRLRGPYDVGPLRSALEELLGDTTLAESALRLAIPAFDQTSNDVYLFRTPHLQHLRRDQRERMVDVGLATTAAPTYLPAHQINGLRLIDGGVWALNPTMVGVVEAFSCGADAHEIHVLNVGTTSEVVHRSTRLDNGSPLRWLREIVDVVFQGQSLVAVNHSRLLLSPEQVRRIDVPIPKGLHGLDRVDTNNLIGHAMAASRKASPKLTEFFAHDAPTYPHH